jgi:hypothetical protein
MAITSTSTLDEIAAAYLDSAGYDLPGGSVAMCEDFVVACRALQLKRPVSVTVDGNPVTFDYRAMADQLRHALSWLAANRVPSGAGGIAGVRTYDMSGVRR